MQRNLPTGWSVKPLEKVATLQRRFDLPIQVREEGRIPVYGSNGIDGWHSRAAVSGPGVITGRSGTIGSVYFETRDYWPLNTTLYVRDFHGNEPRFIARMLESLDLKRFAASTGVPSLNRNFVHPTPIILPPPDEQFRIAAVLDTVDEATAKTEAAITKLKQVRAGLLHDLLTRGLDEHGQLRDHIIHPEQFHGSPLGRIPINWSVKELKDCYAVPSRNGLYKKATYYGSGHRMIHMPQMFKDSTVDVAEAVRVAVEAEELQRYSLDSGDLLFARRSLNLEGAGLCSIVPALDEPVTFESSIVRVRLDQNIILPSFAVEFLRSELGYLLRRPFIRQVAVSGVSSEDIGHFLVPCPKADEQGRILTVLDSYDQGLRLYEAALRKLVHLKSGLMSDLLTGRVRVPELEDERHCR